MVQCSCCNKAWDSELARPVPWKSQALKVLGSEKSESVLFRLPGRTVTTSKTSEILGLWFVWSLSHLWGITRNHHFVFSCFHQEKYLIERERAFFQHSLEWRDFFVCCVHALLSCHGTPADFDMNYLNWTDWLLHSSSRSLCGQSLDVHCQHERINRKTKNGVIVCLMLLHQWCSSCTIILQFCILYISG